MKAFAYLLFLLAALGLCIAMFNILSGSLATDDLARYQGRIAGSLCFPILFALGGLFLLRRARAQEREQPPEA